MGYTHYFTVDPVNQTVPSDAFGRLALDVKRICEEAAAQGIDIRSEFDESTPAEITEASIRLNGAGDDGHETFYVAHDQSGFDFCKTARKPYDAVVCAALARMKIHYGASVQVSSDGQDEWDMESGASWSDTGESEWAQARRFYVQVFGEPMPCPFEPAVV